MICVIVPNLIASVNISIIEVCGYFYFHVKYHISSYFNRVFHPVSGLFWKAPELLRNPHASIRGTREGDIYSFAIILYEMLGRKGPYGNINLEPKGNHNNTKK